MFYSIYFLMLAFLGGVVFQCITLLRARPSRVSIILFFGMLIYMSVLLIYSILSSSAGYSESNFIREVFSVGMTLSFMFTILFIAIFLREVVKIVNEEVILSLTISFWFFVLSNFDYQIIPTVFLIVIGLIPSAVAIYLFFSSKKVGLPIKVFMYAWMLFVNFMFALSFIFRLPFNLFVLNVDQYEGMFSVVELLDIFIAWLCAPAGYHSRK